MNYFGGSIKVLETPKQKLIKKNISITKFRCQLPQSRTNKIVTAIFWGSLSQDIINYYKVNDYLLIEGYLSLKTKSSSKEMKFLKKIEITVLKVYPFLLNSNITFSKL